MVTVKNERNSEKMMPEFLNANTTPQLLPRVCPTTVHFMSSYGLRTVLEPFYLYYVLR